MLPIYIKVAIIATVIAAAATGIIIGIIVAVVPSAEDSCLNIEPPSNLKVTKKENHIVIQWSPTPSNCHVYYALEVTMDGDINPIQYETTDTFFTISRLPKYCTNVDVGISAVGNEAISDAVFLSYLVPPTEEEVRNAIIKVQSYDHMINMLEWTNIAETFNGCTVKYRLIVNDQEVAPDLETNHYYFKNGLTKQCKDNEIILIPIVEGIFGTKNELTDDVEVPPSKDKINAVALSLGPYVPTAKVLTWTDYEVVFSRCTVKYRLTVNDIPIQPDLITNTFKFTDELTKQCKDNIVTLMPIVSGVNGLEKIISDHIEAPPSEDEINAVTFSLDPYLPTAKILTWTDYEAEFSGCTVTYRLTVNDIPIQPDLITNTFKFTDELTNPCKDNTVKLMPIVSGVNGLEKVISDHIEAPPSEDDINAVTFSLDPYVPTAKILTWTDYEAEFSGCTVTYRLTVNDIPIQPDLITNTFKFTDELTNPCKDNIVKLMPIVSGVNGLEKVISDHIEAPPSEDDINAVAFSLDPYVPTAKILTWTDYEAEFTGCTVTYRLTVNDIPIQTDLITNTFKFTDELTNPCKDNTVKLMPIVSGVNGLEKVISDHIEAPPSEDDINAVTFSLDPYLPTAKILTWTDYEAEFSGCTVTYHLTVNDIPIQPDLITNTFKFTDELTNPCKDNTVKLMPIVSGVNGLEKVISDHIEAPPSEDDINAVTFSLDPYLPTAKILTWTDYEAEFSGCTVTYHLTVNDIPIQPDLITNTFKFTDELTNPCKDNTVKLMPIVSGVNGLENIISDHIEAPPSEDDINAVTFSLDPYVPTAKILTWTDYKAEFSGCTVTYRLTINDIPIQPDLITNTFKFTDELTNPCKDNTVKLMPVVSGVNGLEKVISDHIEAPPSEDDINAVAFSLDPYVPTAKILTWTDYEAEFSGCTVTYRLTVNDIPMQPDLITNTFKFTDELTNPCRDNTVKLMPIVSGVNGLEKVISDHIEAPPSEDEINAVTFSLDPYVPTAKILTWTDYEAEFSGCTVTYRLTVNDIPIQPDLITNTFKFTDELTNPCKDNIVKLMPIVSGVNGLEKVISDHIEAPPSEDEINAVAFSLDPYVPTAKILTWTDYEAEFSGCTVTYRLTVNDIAMQPDLITNTFKFTNELTNPCKDNTVKLMPIVSGVNGLEKVISDHIEAPPSEDEINAVAFSLDPYVPTAKILTWTDYEAEFSGCTVTYRLTVNDIPIQPDLITNTFKFTDELTNPCKDNTVKLMPIVSGVNGLEKVISDYIEAPPSEDEINAVTFSLDSYVPTAKILTWTDYEAEFSGCTVIYRLTVNDIPIQPDLITNTFKFTDELTNPCKDNTVKLMPIVSGVNGLEKVISDYIEAPPSEDEINAVMFSLDPYVPTAKILTWTDYKAEFSGCTVTYRLTVNDIPIQTDLITNTFKFTDELTNPCKDNTVTLIPIVSGVNGLEKVISDHIEAPPSEDDINAVAFSLDPYVPTAKILTWTDYEAEFSGCTVTYRLTVNDIPMQPDLITNTFQFTDELSKECNGNTVVLMPIVAGVEGENKILSNDVDELPEITDGSFELITEGNMLITWKPPLTLETCEFTYDLELRETQELDSITLDSFEDYNEVEPFIWEPSNVDGITDCGVMVVIITPKYKSKSGTSTSLGCTMQSLSLHVL
ncbi:uncharacterized protein [Onthophagus taurus]|uniref:uncharacterized protein isoform X3 n=1 Tax=Onthophagus taurus TaxID=166361 RepID=UPI0039BEB489